MCVLWCCFGCGEELLLSPAAGGEGVVVAHADRCLVACRCARFGVVLGCHHAILLVCTWCFSLWLLSPSVPAALRVLCRVGGHRLGVCASGRGVPTESSPELSLYVVVAGKLRRCALHGRSAREPLLGPFFDGRRKAEKHQGPNRTGLLALDFQQYRGGGDNAPPPFLAPFGLALPCLPAGMVR